MEPKRLLSQRMKDILKIIGEHSVLLKLYIMAENYENWNVYQNLSDLGYDLLLINSKNNNKIKIEVKTRQKLHSTAKTKINPQFTLSKNEYDSCNFLVGFWFELGHYYIVPKINLKPANSNDSILYKYAVTNLSLENTYFNNWSLIENEIIRLS